MMKHAFHMISMLLAVSLAAQSPKNVVVEHFTNTVCSICASRNPAFYQTLSNYPQVFHIAFYPSAPYQNCYFSQQNKTENDARTNYYGVYGFTPQVVVQGKVIPSANPSITNATLDSVLNQTSPVELSVAEEFKGADSVRVRITVKTTGGTSLTTAILFAGATENPIAYNAANGETMHYDVFRKTLTNITGDVITLPALNDSAVFEFTYTIGNGWNISNLRSLAILQQSDKRVLNAARSAGVEISTSITPVDEARLRIYPNPATDLLHVNAEQKENAIIYNLYGEIIWQYALIGGNNQVDISALPNGIYFLKAGTSATRFVKQ